MKIAIVGLGLIGGSLAKAIKKNTEHSCFALDVDRAAIAGALAQEAIDGEITADELHSCDVVMICLHPAQTINFMIENKEHFKKDRFATLNGMQIDELGEDSCVCSMTLTDDHRNAYGGVMGGVTFTLADFALAVTSNQIHSLSVAQQVSINVFSSSISFRPLLLPITVLASIAVTGISSLMPIRSATDVDPALVLKGE